MITQRDDASAHPNKMAHPAEDGNAASGAAVGEGGLQRVAENDDGPSPRRQASGGAAFARLKWSELRQVVPYTWRPRLAVGMKILVPEKTGWPNSGPVANVVRTLPVAALTRVTV
jgi:hypothetical protein